MKVSGKSRVLITGGSGLLGLNWGYQIAGELDVVLALHNRTIKPAGLFCENLDLSNPDSLLGFLAGIKPDCIVHTAGLTSIEACEKDPALARHVNAELAINVARACRSLQIPMIHISTDNLFDGAQAMVTEDHPLNPVNVYGRTKAEAEKGILDILDDALIVRTNFYGWGPRYKPSFSDTIVGSLREGRQLSLFEDVYYTPILISELVSASHQLLAQGSRGIFNVCGDDRLSKWEFGLKVADSFGLDASLIAPGRLSDLPNLTSRPYDMSMSNRKTSELLGRKIGSIDEHLAKLVNQETSPETQEIRAVDPIR